MEERNNSGAHHASMSAEDRVRDVVASFNNSPGLQAKHRLDDEKLKAVYNLVCGTGKASWILKVKEILKAFLLGRRIIFEWQAQ